jgi:hypothetical protein
MDVGEIAQFVVRLADAVKFLRRVEFVIDVFPFPGANEIFLPGGIQALANDAVAAGRARIP